MPMRTARIGLPAPTLLGLSLLAACAHAGGGSGNEPPAPGQPNAYVQALDAAIGAAECQEDRECKAVAVGHKPCGGPSGFKVYSTRGGNAQVIEALAEQERAAAKAAEKPGMVSDCMLIEPPYVSCRAGHCAAGGSER
ncbi:MAG: hypothetical protein HYV16_00265 [Gammaproteobacteria bacterium]|nr:hypothetical protein [Gammaproteobacteria bacterium]